MSLPLDLNDEIGRNRQALAPLACRLRPHSFATFVGQEHLLGVGKPLQQMLESGVRQSLLFWGPPGCGKTSLACLIASEIDAQVHALSAVDSGAREVRGVIEKASERACLGKRTVLFIDEVDRFNKAQQDLLLPSIEQGTVLFIGATTENPAFAINNALLSRVRMFVLRPHTPQHLTAVIDFALSDHQHGLGDFGLSLDAEAKQLLMDYSGGDVRRLLNALEHCVLGLQAPEQGATLTGDDIKGSLGDVATAVFDKRGDHFFDQISALHKAVRGSSADAALYWLARMLEGGCDPLYIARRLVRMASEDIGHADPQALTQALAAWESIERLGSPEGELALAQAVTYLAFAPKSDALYRAYKKARALARKKPNLPVPLHLRNAPAKLLKEMGHGSDYRYAHDYPHGYVPGEQYWPSQLAGERLYEPVTRGFERQLQRRQAWFNKADRASQWQRFCEQTDGGND